MRIKAAIAVLSGAVCLASFAVGADAATAPAGQTAAGCDPSWHLVAAPPAPLSEFNYMTSVDVLSPGDAWFTGYAYPETDRIPSGSSYEIMMDHWNGKAISSVPSPAAGYAPDPAASVGPDLTLDSSADGWLGAGSTASGSPALRLHDGRWTPTPTATFPGSDGKSFGYTFGTASISPTDAWAVGSFSNSSAAGIAGTAVIERWDGTQWTIAATPSPPDPVSQLLALKAVSPSDIWAVGWQGANSYTDTIPLVEHFDGTSWHLVTAPVPGGSGTSAYPSAISGTGPDDIWMAGYVSQNGDGGERPDSTSFVEHWNGTSWSAPTTSLPAGGAATANSLYAASPTDVWANQYNNGTGASPDFLHFDGHSWTAVPLPGPREYGLSYRYLAISGSGPDDAWAVGYATSNLPVYGVTGDVPLIAHLSCG